MQELNQKLIHRKLILLREAIVRKATKDEAFRRLLLEDPRKALVEATGKPVPRGVEVRVYQDSRNVLHVAMPLDVTLSRGRRAEENLPTDGSVQDFADALAETLDPS